jgi:hypothetical protein
MTTTVIRDDIKTGVVFEACRARPKWFNWKKEKIDIREITFSWRTLEGNATVTHYSVTGGRGYYEISFNHKTLGWMLEKTAVE